MLFREDTVARADAEAIRKGVGFYRWTHDLVEITGKDALEVLQKIYISDISKVAVGRSKYTASLDENGEIIDDVIVMHMADGLYWVSDLYGPRLLPWIEQHKGEADIHAKIITYDWDMYAVQGPDSLKAMNAMLDAPVDDLKRFGICERKLGDILDEIDEQRGLGSEVGLGIDLDDDADAVLDSGVSHALGSDAAGLLCGLRQALFTQPLNGLVHIAVILGQCLLAVHHADVGHFTQFLDISSSKIGRASCRERV